jgi:WD40 repeat protein
LTSVYRLEGHTDVAAYALEWHPNDPIVASGGKDRQILLWNIDQYFNTHGRIPEEEKDFNNYGSILRDETLINDPTADQLPAIQPP